MDKLGLNGGLLLAQLVNFIVVVLVLWLAMWKPLVRALETRRERIAKGLEDAQAAEQKLANAEREAQKLIDQRRAEANKLVEEARGRGEEQAKAIIEEANRRAEEIRTKAQTEAVEKRDSMLSDVRSQVASIAIAAAERVIGQSLDASKSQAIVADFIAHVPDSVANLGGAVEVTSALPLTADEQSKVKSKTSAQTISFKVDPALLGGLIVRSGDKVVDASIRSGLSNLATKMY